MELNINIFDIDWAKKGNNGKRVYGADVYISASRHTERNSVYIGFRNDKLPRTIEYIQVARIGSLLLFKEADENTGWKLSDTNSLMRSRNIHPSANALNDEILSLVKEHNQQGFDLQFDAKSKIYFIDTNKVVN